VLVALRAGPATVKDIAATSALSDATVRRNLKVLESAGLIILSETRPVVARLASDAPEEALDRWVQLVGQPGAAQQLRERHRSHRVLRELAAASRTRPM
jgi:DNA-binding IclR family transcriptional regulator